MKHLRLVGLGLGLCLCAVAGQADDLDELLRILKSDAADNADYAAKILKAAEDLPENPELQSKLYQKAYEVALTHEKGYATAIQAARMLLETKPKERTTWRGKLLSAHELRFRKAPPEERQQLGEAYLAQLVVAADEIVQSGEDVPTAVRYYTQATALARNYCKARTPEIAYKLKLARQRQLLKVRVDAYKSRLKRNPGDDAARAGLIHIYVAEFDQAAEAQKLLTANMEKDWGKCVPLAVKDPGKVSKDECFELANWYRELVEKASVVGEPKMLRRSEAYYQRFLASESSGLRATTARLALVTIEKQLEAIAAATNPKAEGGPITTKVKVPAGKDWTPVARVGKGDVIEIAAEGKWSPKSGTSLDAEGNPYTKMHHLQGRFGEDARPFRIGAKHQVTAMMDCVLYMGMKDDWSHRDNSGFLTVTITIQREK